MRHFLWNTLLALTWALMTVQTISKRADRPVEGIDRMNGTFMQRG